MSEDEFTDAEAKAFSESLVARIRERASEKKMSLWKSTGITVKHLSDVKQMATGEKIPWPAKAYGRVVLWLGALMTDENGSGDAKNFE